MFYIPLFVIRTKLWVCVCVGFVMCGCVYVCNVMCVCMCGFCNVWVCVCMCGFCNVWVCVCVLCTALCIRF